MAYLQKIGAWHPWLCATANYSEKVCAKVLETNLKRWLVTFILQNNAGDWKEWVCLRERTAEVCSLTPAEQEMMNVHCSQIKQTGVSKARSWHEAYRRDGKTHLESNPSRWHYMCSVSVAYEPAWLMAGGEVETLQPCWRVS